MFSETRMLRDMRSEEDEEEESEEIQEILKEKALDFGYFVGMAGYDVGASHLASIYGTERDKYVCC